MSQLVSYNPAGLFLRLMKILKVIKLVRDIGIFRFTRIIRIIRVVRGIEATSSKSTLQEKMVLLRNKAFVEVSVTCIV